MESTGRIGELLAGHGQGRAVALINCTVELAQAVAGRWPEGIVTPVSCTDHIARLEHPHSAFVRKPIDCDGHPALRTTLHAPDGRLTEERLLDGTAVTPFVKKPKDMEILRGHLRDVELLPGPQAEGCAIAQLGRTARAELRERWLGNTEASWTADDEATASCLRKLDRQLRRRGELAVSAGYACGLLADRPEGTPENWVEYNHVTLEHLRQAGLPPFVEPAEPTGAWAEALRGCHAGLAAPLFGETLAGGALPRRLRLLLRTNLAELADGLPEGAARLLTGCDRIVVLVDCAGITDTAALEPLASLLA